MLVSRLPTRIAVGGSSCRTLITRTLQSRAFRRAVTNLQYAIGNVHMASSSSARDEEHQNLDRYRKGVPSLIQIRNFADTTTTTTKMASDDADKPTLRERAAKRAKQGTRLAKKGAITAGEMMRQYGPVFVGTYFTVYMTTLGSLFLGVSSGLIDPMTILTFLKGTAITGGGAEDAETAKSTVQWVVEWMQNHTITEPYAPMVEKNPYVANLAVSWIAIKFTEPIRLGVTLAIVPRLARYLGYVVPAKKDADDEEKTKNDSKGSPEEGLKQDIKEWMKSK